MKKLYLIRLLWVAMFFGAFNANAAVRYVNGGVTISGDGNSWHSPYKTLQEAITAASSGDEIWVAAGTYQPASGQSFAMKEGVKIYGGFAGTENSLAQRNWKTNATILKGNGSRVINNTNNGLTAAAALDGFTVRDGAFTGDYAIDDHGFGGRAAGAGLGGGVYNENVSPVFNNCLFINNTTTGGSGTMLSRSSASGIGGAIYNLNGSPTISNSYFTGNRAKGGSSYSSGAAAYGGAIYNKDANTKIFNCVFYNNNVEGGVLQNVGMGSSTPTASYGGAIANENGAPNLVNLTVYKNTSGIYNSGSNVTISNSAVWDNGGTQIQNNGGSPVITYNLVKGGFAGTGNIDVYPMFLNPDDPDGADNIWGTNDDGLRLQNGSPAVDAGRQNLLVNGTTTDILGNARLQASNVDMGAYEGAIAARGVIYVNANATGANDGSNWENAYANFGTALTAAVNADQVWVAAGTYQPASGQSFSMKEGVKIYGGFAGTESSLAQRNWKTNATILKGNGSRVINNTNNGLTAATVLDGFTIRDGAFTGDYAIDNHGLGGGRPAVAGLGGGVYNENVSPVFNNCLFTNNTATGGAGSILSVSSASGIGGAIYNLNGSPTISNSYFTGNRAKGGGSYSSGAAAYGGAIYNRDATTKIFNCVFYNNNAQGGQSGYGGSSAAHYGGAIANENGTPVLVNLTIYKNSTGVYNSGSNVNISNSIIFDNGGAEINNNGGGTPIITYNLIKGGFAGTGNVDADPKFIDANDPDGADNIWGTADDGLSLKSNSPAMNSGSNALYTGLDAETKDLKGNPRVYDHANGGVIDMGAYEYQGVTVTPDANGTVFVKKGSTGKGTSWTNAIGELADALIGAKTNTEIRQIWVAAGSYKPRYSPEDGVKFGTDQGSSNSFLMVKDVKVYGGFAGTETSLSQRDFYANLSTLSGDLGAFGKSYNVVISSGPMGLATLDGFTIRDGDASNSSYFYVNGNQVYPCSGAGIYNSVSDAFYNNLIVMNNSSGESGGGMFSYRSSVRLSNVTMKNNSARHGGAMANQDNSHATVINSLFISNSSSDGGDAIYNVDGSLPKFVNITVAKNSGSAKNGILNENNAEPKVYNSIVWGGIDGDYQAQNSIIQYSADATNANIDASSLNDTDLFTNPASDDFTLKSGSPIINKGSNTLYEAADGDNNNNSLANGKDLAGNSRVYNLITGGTIDLGAYEYQGTLSQTISFAALDAKTTNSADFTLGATASSGLEVSYTSSNTNIAEVYQDNSVWKVKIKAAGSVVITASQSGNGDYAAATAVDQTLVIADGTLPVQLTNYTAKVVNQTARLDWSVSSERDNRKFVIYRSGDDNQFAEIGGVASFGNTSTNRNYFFVDKQPLNGNNYYKLVQVDLDGKPTELGVKPLNFILSAVHVSVYPNPTKERVNVTFEAGKYNRAALSSIEGKVLKSFGLSTQQNQLAIDLSAYSIGTYFIRLTGAQQSIVKKVVKQ